MYREVVTWEIQRVSKNGCFAWKCGIAFFFQFNSILFQQSSCIRLMKANAYRMLNRRMPEAVFIQREDHYKARKQQFLCEFGMAVGE